ncbi:MAG: MBL fold metallo-hydrolase [bacterium]|nr:MBL fold metallo-hydrolase [bacterium]
MRIETLDLEYQNTPHTVAAFLVLGDGAPVLVETGPASTLPALERGLAEHGVAIGDIRHVLVTHIHLDHAGAAGWWAQRGSQVYVHRRGAPHLIDPSKLLASATRIYGELMDSLWGEVMAAPAERVTVVEDGDVLEIEGLRFSVLETPGHARHHHVYRLEDIAFTGDAAGIRISGSDWIDLPAPPPEFELDAWKSTLGKLRRQDLRALYRTHFGPSEDVAQELDRFEELLIETVETIRNLAARGLDREAMLARYTDWVADRGRASGADDETMGVYAIANPRDMSVDGVLRHLRHLDG